jgi:hypothetical protein
LDQLSHRNVWTACREAVESLPWNLRRLLPGLDWPTLIAFGLPLSIYLLTLAPTIYGLDSAELTTAAYTGGLMRSTGYPLYLVVGYFWSRLPFGDAGYRMNLFSAVMGALTIALAYRILRRLRVGHWAALGALGLLASAPFFWGLSLVAEVYTLHTALMAGLILALLRWGEAPSPHRLAVVGLLGGLSMSHHMATVLLVPGCLWFVLTAAPRQIFSWRSLSAAAMGALGGLSFYIYLPVRFSAHPVFNYAGTYDAGLNFHPVNLQTLAGMLWLLSGQAFENQMLVYHGAQLWQEIVHFASQLGQAFFLVGVGPGLLGLVLLFRRNWRVAGMLALMFLCNSAFYVDYRVIDKDTMFLPAYLIWGLWVGVGLAGLLTWLKRSSQTNDIAFASSNWMQIAIFGVVLIAVTWNWHLVDLSHDWSARQRAETILRNAQPNAIVFGWWDTVPVIQYLQLVEGQRPDVQAINRFLIAPADLNQYVEEEVNSQPIYMDAFSNDLHTTVNAEPAGPIYRLVPAAQTVSHLKLKKTHSGGEP